MNFLSNLWSNVKKEVARIPQTVSEVYSGAKSAAQNVFGGSLASVAGLPGAAKDVATAKSAAEQKAVSQAASAVKQATSKTVTFPAAGAFPDQITLPGTSAQLTGGIATGQQLQPTQPVDYFQQAQNIIQNTVPAIPPTQDRQGGGGMTWLPGIGGVSTEFLKYYDWNPEWMQFVPKKTATISTPTPKVGGSQWASQASTTSPAGVTSVAGGPFMGTNESQAGMLSEEDKKKQTEETLKNLQSRPDFQQYLADFQKQNQMTPTAETLVNSYLKETAGGKTAYAGLIGPTLPATGGNVPEVPKANELFPTREQQIAKATEALGNIQSTYDQLVKTYNDELRAQQAKQLPDNALPKAPTDDSYLVDIYNQIQKRYGLDTEIQNIKTEMDKITAFETAADSVIEGIKDDPDMWVSARDKRVAFWTDHKKRQMDIMEKALKNRVDIYNLMEGRVKEEFSVYQGQYNANVQQRERDTDNARAELSLLLSSGGFAGATPEQIQLWSQRTGIPADTLALAAQNKEAQTDLSNEIKRLQIEKASLSLSNAQATSGVQSKIETDINKVVDQYKINPEGFRERLINQLVSKYGEANRGLVTDSVYNLLPSIVSGNKFNPIKTDTLDGFINSSIDKYFGSSTSSQ